MGFFRCDKHIESYVKNLTSSYANKSNESSVVATSVVMFVLAAIFFNLNLFSRASNISAILNPTVRLFISTVLSLFLPIMSYLFSEAKNAYMVDSGPNFRGSSLDLPLRARVILTWMLLVELLRKKVEAILVNAGMQRYSTIINHTGSVAWLGNLVFFNLKRAGQKTVYGTLWLVCAAKLVQRVAIAELAKRSLAYGKNARLMSSYATQMSRRNVLVDGTGTQVLESCEYVVMGEEKLVLKPGPRGYKLLDQDKIATDQTVVTVRKIWQLDELELKGDIRLKRLCLSFALFKLLRRRFEHLPAMTREETIYCRALIFEGLCKKEVGVPDPEMALFQVINDEVYFLSEYYNSVLPVVLASPYFFLVNYLVVPVVIAVLCIMTVNLCGNGNMAFALRSINVDNDAISIGIVTLTKCLLKNVLKTPAAFFSSVDLTITYLLFLAVIYEEVWEFLVFVHSKWFMVSLVCTYTAETKRSTLLWALRRISWVHDKLSDPSRITIKQYSVMRFCWLSVTLPSTSLPRRAKRLIMKRLLAYGRDSSQAAALSTGKAALGQRYPHLSWFCESDSVAEVILTWHIATSLLEMNNGGSPGEDRSKVVATRLSQYCAYLVAFHPELLPDDPEGTESAYTDMTKDLKEKMGCWTYYSSWKCLWCKKMMLIAGKLEQATAHTVVQKGVLLGKELIAEAQKKSQVSGWEVLADVWVELIVYIAPSGCDEHVKGHEESLVQGGELITMLWALSTHTGITRPQPTVDEGAHPAGV